MTNPPLRPQDSATYITVGGQTFAVQSNAIDVAGTLLKPGDPGVSYDGTPVSLGSSIFVVGTRTETLSPRPTILTGHQSYVTVESAILTEDFNGISIDGTTLRPLGPAITVSGTRISLGPSFLVVGTQTETLSPRLSLPSDQQRYITVGNAMFTEDSNGVIVDGTTLRPLDPAITVSGTVVSLGSSFLVVGTQTQNLALATPAITTFPSSSSSIITFDGQIITIASTGITVAGHFLSPGESTTLSDGTLISLEAEALIVGAQTTSLAFPVGSGTPNAGIGAMIMYGLGSIGGIVSSQDAQTTPVAVSTFAESSNGSSIVNGTLQFYGKAERNEMELVWWVILMGLMLGILLVD